MGHSLRFALVALGANLLAGLQLDEHLHNNLDAFPQEIAIYIQFMLA
jgi:hypothetical protein